MALNDFLKRVADAKIRKTTFSRQGKSKYRSNVLQTFLHTQLPVYNDHWVSYHTVLQNNLTVYVQSILDISKFWGLFFTSSNYPKCKFICTSGNLDLWKSLRCQIMVEESNQNVFLIQKNASNFAEFEISEFDISRVDCIYFITDKYMHVYAFCLRFA